MSGYVHGGTDAKEIARLEKQADFTAGFTFSHFDAAPGMAVLDLATGVGAMAARLLRRFEGIHVVGVDLSASQLEAARALHPEVPLVRGDGTRLPFPDCAFDRVHASWFLEHVPAPVAALREVLRVLKPGGRCQFIEVDNDSFGTTPEFPEVRLVMRALNTAQVKAGGDPFVGQRLDQHFRDAGFRRFTLEPCRIVGDARDPAFFATCIDEFSEIFDGLDESLGAALGEALPRAAAQLRSLATLPGGQVRYTSVLAKGTRD